MAADTATRGHARQRLLDAAESLFASHGAEAISLRQVNAAAGVSPGILHYHFGSREILLHELINRHLGALMTERAALLEPMLTRDKPPLRDVVAALVNPFARLALETGEPGARYVGFFSRLHSDRSAALEEAMQRYAGVDENLRSLLSRALGNPDPADLDFKLSMATHAMLQALTELAQRDEPGRATSRETAMLIDFISDGLAGGRNHG